LPVFRSSMGLLGRAKSCVRICSRHLAILRVYTGKSTRYSIGSFGKYLAHWFTAEGDTGFLFNVHVVETNPENPKRPGRVYVDLMGEKLAGGLIKAPKISYGKVNQLYG